MSGPAGGMGGITLTLALSPQGRGDWTPPPRFLAGPRNDRGEGGGVGSADVTEWRWWTAPRSTLRLVAQGERPRGGGGDHPHPSPLPSRERGQDHRPPDSSRGLGMTGEKGVGWGVRT